MTKEAMQEHLNFFWEGNFNFAIPMTNSTQNAVKIFKQNLAPITWHAMTTLENNPTSLPQTETILKGHSVTGLSIDELLQVKNYGNGATCLMAMLADGTFSLNEKTVCAIHNLVGKEDALTWGAFRNTQVNIIQVDYNPPPCEQLKEIAEKGFAFLQKGITSPVERAYATFLFMARTQFFHDANKRTASLMMNGVLMQNAFFPVTIQNQNSEEFHTTLREFYNSGNATAMMRFFEKSGRELYPPQPTTKGSPTGG